MDSKKILTISLLLAGLNSFSQNSLDSLNTKEKPPAIIKSLPAVDVYLTIPRYGGGAGAGFGFFSQAFVVEQFGPSQKLEFRLGGDLFFLQYNQNKLGTVPLTAPQTGEAKVKLTQNNFGFNLVGRFLLVSSPDRFSPYLDLFAGVRGFSTDMEITPLKSQEGYESSTSTNLSTVNQWNYGATFGMMFSLSKNIKLNTGLMYSTSSQGGQIDNIQGARIEGGSVITDKIDVPRDFWVFKVGLTFLVNSSSSNNNDRDCDCNCNKKSRSSGADIYIPSLGGGVLKSNSVNFSRGPLR